MAAGPGTVLQKLVDLTLELCRADSAGISILEPGGESGLFRWHAAAGAFAAYLGGTMPREAAPCDTAIAQNTVLLLDRAERHFPALQGVQPPIFENLLMPFHLNGQPVGTVWAIAHQPERKFDREDARLLSSLARFASVAYQLIQAREAAEAGRQELEQRVQEWTAALRHSEERLRRATEIETVGILFFKTDGRISDANDAFLRMSGCSREDLGQGRVRWDTMTPPESLPPSF
jgi:GAF domain-containing protein